MQAASESGGREKWVFFCSVWHGIGRLSMGQGPGCQSLILIAALSSASWEKKRKREKEEEKKRNGQELLFPGLDMLC
jgi:hypothetical protein